MQTVLLSLVVASVFVLVAAALREAVFPMRCSERRWRQFETLAARTADPRFIDAVRHRQLTRRQARRWIDALCRGADDSQR